MISDLVIQRNVLWQNMHEQHSLPGEVDAPALPPMMDSTLSESAEDIKLISLKDTYLMLAKSLLSWHVKPGRYGDCTRSAS